MTEQFDAIVVGTGQAGPSLVARLHGAGMKVAVIEADRMGGTCVNYGCIPTKTLVASARAAYMARRATDFGVNVAGDVTVDMPAVKARMKEISGQSNTGLEGWLGGMENVTVVRGHGRLAGDGKVQVDDRVLQAEKIFLNVGGRARVPDFPGIDEVEFLTNKEILELDTLPEHLVVVGGSYIGLEFAQIYRRFGSKVTVVHRGKRLVDREDEDVSAAILEILRGEGIDVRLESECVTLAKDSNGVSVGVACDGGPPAVVGSHVLLAVGRVPNTDDLGLADAGVKVDGRGYIEVDDELRTNVEGIWALGDCNGKGGFTHTAYNDYEIAAANLLDGDPRRVSDRILCYGLFIDPPLGRVGMTETQARKSGRKLLVGTRPMSRVGRAVEKSETAGAMKIIADAETREILGASILGVTGDEVVQTLLPVMYAKAPYTTISRAVHVHPTVAELLPTVLQEMRPIE